MNLQQQLGPEWYDLLGPLFAEEWMETLGRRIEYVAEKGELQPQLYEIFRAYRLVQPSQLKVLIIGQDPYPMGQADGLAFSTKRALAPKTLQIVFEELSRTGFGHRSNPDLTDWAEQGVMLLNTILTCTTGETLSHKGWGWERFIGATLDHINNLEQPFVVMSWGTPARELIKEYINFTDSYDKPPPANRLWLKAIHPVAESRSNGRMKFVGCDHFDSGNIFLKCHNIEPINWNP